MQTFLSPAVGTRLTFVIDHSVARGPLLNGEFLPGGGDWVTLGPDGIGRLDARATLRADDGQLIHVTVTGRSAIAGAALERYFAGETVTWAEAYIRSSVLFETDSKQYGWLNGTVTTAINEVGIDHVHYRIYRVA